MDLQYLRRHFWEYARGVLRGHPRVRIARGVRLNGPGRYVLHPGSSISRNARIWVGDGATLELGRGAKIGTRNVINVATGLTIGERTELSWDVQVLDTDFHWIRTTDGIVRPPSRPVAIEDHVLVGAGSFILKGVTIGRGSVVGAGTVLRRSVEEGSIVTGNPATVVGHAQDWGTAPPTPIGDAGRTTSSPGSGTGPRRSPSR